MMILVSGGSASGKSEYAESLCADAGSAKYYIATMQPFGEDGRERIARHRELRKGKGFETIERYTDFADLVLPARGTVLLECIGNLCTNEMFDENYNVKNPVPAVLSGVAALNAQCEKLVIVTNETGSDINEYSEETMAYIRAMGEINSELSKLADCVYEVVCCIPIKHKG